MPHLFGHVQADLDQPGRHRVRLLAVAKYDERYVIPPAHRENAAALADLDTGCSLDGVGRPGMTDAPAMVTRRPDGRTGLSLTPRAPGEAG